MKIYVSNKNKFLEIMKTNGYSQSSLAIKIGITRQYITKIINGCSIGPETSKKIHLVLGVNFNDIFFIKPLTKVI